MTKKPVTPQEALQAINAAPPSETVEGVLGGAVGAGAPEVKAKTVRFRFLRAGKMDRRLKDGTEISLRRVRSNRQGEGFSEGGLLETSDPALIEKVRIEAKSDAKIVELAW